MNFLFRNMNIRKLISYVKLKWAIKCEMSMFIIRRELYLLWEINNVKI